MCRIIRLCKFIMVVPLVFFHSQAFSASLDDISINGYFSFEYEKTISGDDEEDVNGSFDLDLIDLVFNFDATDKLRIATDFTWEHGAASEDGRGNVAVEYAFAEYTINNLFKVKAGKMFTHFSIYNEIHTAKPANLTIKEPLATNKNNKFGSEIRFYPRWLTGLGFAGNGDAGEWEFDYDVQISNGETDSDANPFEEDDNTHKAINGRIRFMPSDSMKFGFSFYDDAMEDPENEGEQFEISSYAAHLEYDSYTHVGVELEYIFGSVNMTALADGEVDRNAFSVMGFYHLNNKLITYIRYESLDPNTDADDDEANKLILGLNWMVDKNMYLKFEVDEVSTEDQNDKFEGADFSEFKASLSIGF